MTFSRTHWLLPTLLVVVLVEEEDGETGFTREEDAELLAGATIVLKLVNEEEAAALEVVLEEEDDAGATIAEVEEEDNTAAEDIAEELEDAATAAFEDEEVPTGAATALVVDEDAAAEDAAFGEEAATGAALELELATGEVVFEFVKLAPQFVVWIVASPGPHCKGLQPGRAGRTPLITSVEGAGMWHSPVEGFTPPSLLMLGHWSNPASPASQPSIRACSSTWFQPERKSPCSPWPVGSP